MSQLRCSCSRREFLRKGLTGVGVTAGLPALLSRTSQALAADARQFVGKHDLQVADRRFLEIIAAGVPVKFPPALGIHTDDVAGLVEHRVHRCIRPQVHTSADDAGLGLAPETPGNRRVAVDESRLQSKAIEQTMNSYCVEVADDHDILLHGAGRQIPDSCIMTIRTRSSAMASRNSDSSFSLPSTSVSSQV